MDYKILIVDDALFMRSMLKKHISEMGDFEILEAPDGEKACELCREESPDLVFLDITMPVMDGMETLSRIKEENPQIPVIMCSAMGQQSMVLETLNRGAMDFIVKPFRKEDIQDAVKKTLLQTEGDDEI